MRWFRREGHQWPSLTDQLSSIPGTYMVEGKTDTQGKLSSDSRPHLFCGTCTDHTHTINK